MIGGLGDAIRPRARARTRSDDLVGAAAVLAG